MKTPSLHIARLETELAERCLELAEARQRIGTLEQLLAQHIAWSEDPSSSSRFLSEAKQRINELELTLQHVEWNVGERIKKTSPPK